MKNNKIISIVTVCYNSKNNIKYTLDSVVSQKDLGNIEYIIIDGNSNDGTLKYIESYAKKYNFKYISEKDNGIYDAMNKGIKMASGEYIFFLNSGDTFVDDCVITDVINNLGEEPDIIYGDIIEERNGTKTLIKSNSITISKHSFCKGNMICHQCIFIKSNILKKYMFNLEYSICSDKEVLIRLYKDNYKFNYIERTISLFDRGGVSSINTDLLKKESKQIIYKHYYLYARIIYLLKKIKGTVKK